MSKKINDTDYLYLSAYLRARESTLLTNERVNRMLDAKTYEDAAKVLEECGYGDMTDVNAAELEKRFSEKRDRTMHDLALTAPDSAIVDVFRVKFDYHNAKVLIKSEASGVKGDHLLSGAGRVPPEVLEDAYVRDEMKGVPSVLAQAIREAKDTLARTDDPRLSDFVLDRAYYKEFQELAEESGSSFLVEYGKLAVDSANLRTAVRSARMQKDGAFLRGVLSEGGNVSRDRLITAVSSGTPLASLFGGSPLAEAAASGDEVIAGEKLTRFEKLCDDALSKYLSSAKLSSFSERVLIAYICALETEISTARIILTGRMANIPSDVIRERLREAYV
ncbi:MAG: V-type ATPase subunit [Oscillospiraceae bacterium]|nr:V-type ATPase subunit [Oscillospiraceae bacterium]